MNFEQYHRKEVQPLKDRLDEIDPSAIITAIENKFAARIDNLEKDARELRERVAVLTHKISQPS